MPTRNLESIEEEATDKAGTDGSTLVEDTNSTVKETTKLRLYLTNDGGNTVESQILKEGPLNSKSKWVNVLARWPVKMLVIHMKRFSYSRYMKKKKLDADVDFPLNYLDLSSYISYKDDQTINRYMFYAISNHYGSMESGHYIAYVCCGGDRWYHFDDSQVHQIRQENIKTSAAYVLFYKRL